MIEQCRDALAVTIMILLILLICGFPRFKPCDCWFLSNQTSPVRKQW